MSNAVQFRVELDDLFSRRSAWLQGVLGERRPGPPPTLKKSHVRRAIHRLQELASDSLARHLARREFNHGVMIRRSWHPKDGKGWSYDDKRSRFKSWYRAEINAKNCIYVLWNQKRCVYVGKTTRGGGRIASHFDKRWFPWVTRIDIYETRGHRVLPALECVAIHRFQPLKNRAKAETKKWTRRCPLCEIHRGIESELKSIFRLR